MRLSGLLSAARAFLRAELSNVRQFDVPWRRRLWLYAKGFLSSKDALWDLSSETVDQYLSDLEYRQLKAISEPYNSGLGNKLLFHLLLAPSHGHLLPTVHGHLSDGEFVDVARSGGLQSFDQLVDALDDTPMVVKPVEGAKGDGVRVLDRRDRRVRIDGTAVRRAELIENLTERRDLIVEERVDQAEYAESIFPGSTNTLRVLTMIDPATDEPFIAAATHRFGTPSSGYTDNWSAGGLSAHVDLGTGELGTAIANPATSGPVGRTDRHPDTGVQIAGVSVPGWERITDTVRDLAGSYGSLWPHVGWDVVVRDDQGAITVLEGDPQSVDADQQAHGPLLADERVRRFYEHHGVLSSLRGRVSL